MRPYHLSVFVALAAVSLPLSALAQTAKPAAQKPAQPAMSQKSTVLNLQTKIGSFKMLGVGTTPASGTIVMNFTGTVLVSGLKGKLTPSGNVRREIYHENRGKQVFFGTGKLIIQGSFQGVQWFGRNLTATVDGFGVLRLAGEFDRELNTGFYWYGPKGEKKPWNTGGITVTSTPPVEPKVAAPRVRDIGKGKGKG